MKMGKSGLIPYTALKKRLVRMAGLSVEALKGWEVLKTQKSLKQQALRYDEYSMTPGEWFIYGLQGLAAAGIFAYIFYRSFAAFLIFLPFGVLYPKIKKRDLMEKRLEKLNQEFKEGILLLASFLSAGYSVENAFAASVKELAVLYSAEGMITKEFGHIESQIRMNRSVEQAISGFAGRSGLDDVRNFAEVFAAAKRSGGELVSIISHTAGVIRDKAQVRQDILTMTASKQLEQRIMNLIPVLVVLYIDVTSPGFFDLMYQTGLGRILMTLCLTVYLVSVCLAKQVMRIEV